MSKLLSLWIYAAMILSACSPSPALSVPAGNANLAVGGDCGAPVKVEVELDIFSGNPNPTWVLSEKDASLFLEKLAILPEASAEEMTDNLGYRGLIVRVIDETGMSLVRVQNKTVQISQNDTNAYYIDQERDVERWLLNSGRRAVRSDIFKMVERSLQTN